MLVSFLSDHKGLQHDYNSKIDKSRLRNYVRMKKYRRERGLYKSYNLLTIVVITHAFFTMWSRHCTRPVNCIQQITIIDIKTKIFVAIQIEVTAIGATVAKESSVIYVMTKMTLCLRYNRWVTKTILLSTTDIDILSTF